MRPARAIASTAPGIAPRSTSAVTVVVMRSSRSDESPICSGRSARGKPSIVPWLVMAFSSAIPRLSAKCLPLAIAGTPLAFFQAPLLNLFKGHPIHTLSARIGAGQPIGMAQDVLATDLVVEHIEAESRLRLRSEADDLPTGYSLPIQGGKSLKRGD